jgi:hypothetical protein
MEVEGEAAKVVHGDEVWLEIGVGQCLTIYVNNNWLMLT